MILNDSASETQTESALDVRHVVKTFGSGKNEVRALNSVSVNIQSNEFFTLLGPSGCGKTTLLRLTAGFEQPTSGEIFLFGQEIENLPPHHRPVNTVFQHYSLFPHMSVAENIGFGLRMLKWSGSDIDARVKETLELVKMGEYAKRRTNQLSGGQQQRIALARALAPRPKVLLLDEPLSALDLKLRQAMREELKNLQRETGITFVFVTHDQEEALTMSDRIAVMSAGEIQQIGSPYDIYERPLNRFVADFIGDTNFLTADIAGIDNQLAHCRVAENLRFTVPVVGDRQVGDTVTLAVRPEKIKVYSQAQTPIHNNSAEASGNTQTAIITKATYLGTDTTYGVSINQSLDLIMRDQNFAAGTGRFATGDTVQVQFADGAARMLID